MNKLLLVGVVVALFLSGCGIAMAEEVKPVAKDTWKPSAGTGLLFGVDNRNGLLLDNRGTCVWVDPIKPFEFNLMGKDWEVNTRAIFQERAVNATENDYLGGISVGIKGVTFYKNDAFKLGIDPCILWNASESYRNIFEKEPFVLNETFEIDAIAYLGFYF